jgi:penicillin-insensitive murein endopeptidase
MLRLGHKRLRPGAAALLVALAGCYPAVRDHAGDWSAGAPHRGYLIHGVRIPVRGAGYELFRGPDEGAQMFGTRRLVRAIEHAARFVARHAPGGAPLRVGDLSAPRGGRIERHRSHRNGRDVDLLFFALDAGTRRSVPAPAFVRYDQRGASLDPAHAVAFDVARNWWLVEALAQDEESGVMRIFCADRLRTLLLEYARAHQRPAGVIARAEELLHQPSDAAPHDDHFHVRLACTPDERVAGCRDGGPLAWWLEHHWAKSDSAPLDDAALAALLAPDDQPPAVEPAPGERVEPVRVVRGPGLRALRAPLGRRREARDGEAPDDSHAVDAPPRGECVGCALP